VDSIVSRNLAGGCEYNHERPIVSLFRVRDVKNAGRRPRYVHDNILLNFSFKTKSCRQNV
jgi:hypothetical protein